MRGGRTATTGISRFANDSPDTAFVAEILRWVLFCRLTIPTPPSLMYAVAYGAKRMQEVKKGTKTAIASYTAFGT